MVQSRICTGRMENMADQLTQYFKNNILKYIKQMELDGKFSTGEEIVISCAPIGCNYQQSINMCLPLLIELEREKKIKRAIMGGIPSFRVREERMSEEMKEKFREMEAMDHWEKDHTEEMTNDDIGNFNKMVKKIKASGKPSLLNRVFFATSSKRSGEWSVPVDIIIRHHARKYAYFFGGDVEHCLKKYSLPFFVSDSIVIKYANRYMVWSDIADYAVKIEEEKIDCLPTHKEFEKSWVFFNGIRRKKRNKTEKE